MTAINHLFILESELNYTEPKYAQLGKDQLGFDYARLCTSPFKDRLIRMNMIESEEE